jgi:hypothetical protein
VGCGWMPAHRVARNNCAVGPGVQSERGGAQVERDSARLSTTGLRPALMQLAHEYCALCNLVCLFLASIGTQTAAAVMTYSRIGRS